MTLFAVGRFWVSSGEHSAKGYPRELYGVVGPFPKKAPSMPNPRIGAEPSKPLNPRREETELLPGFWKSKPGENPLFKDLPYFKCFEKGHLARDCPNT